MKKTVSRVLGLTLTTMCLFLLGSCSKNAGSKGIPESEVYRFSFTSGWGVAQGAIPPEEAPNNIHFQYVEKTLKTVPLTQPFEWEGGTGYEQSMRMQLSGGKEKIPEAMQLFSTEFTSELINSGVLMPLDDLLPKYAPNTWNSLSKNEWDLIRSFSPDGKIYFLPVIEKLPRHAMIRKDWLKEVGIDKVPETKAEFVAALKAFKDNDANGNGDKNDEIPISGRQDMRWCDDLFVMHGVSMFEGYPQFHWDDSKKEMVCDQASPEMKNAITFIRDLMKDGIMDKSMPIKNAAEWMAQLGDDKIGEYFHTTSGVPRRLAMRTSGANPDAEWVYQPNVKVDGLPHQKNYAIGIKPHFAITTNARDVKRILKWYDWAGTDEGMIYVYFGIEGVNHKIDGDKIVVDESMTPVSNSHLYAMAWKERTRQMFASMPFGDILVALYDKAIVDSRFIDNMLMPESVFDGYEDYSPGKSSLYKEKCSKMVLGELPMSAWDDYVKEWREKGGDEVTKRATEWYKKVHNIN